MEPDREKRMMQRQYRTPKPGFGYTITQTTLTVPVLTGRHERHFSVLWGSLRCLPSHEEVCINRLAQLSPQNAQTRNRNAPRHPESVKLLWSTCQHADMAIPDTLLAARQTADAQVTPLSVEYLRLAVLSKQLHLLRSLRQSLYPIWLSKTQEGGWEDAQSVNTSSLGVGGRFHSLCQKLSVVGHKTHPSAPDGDRQTSGAQWPTSLSELINSRLLRDPDSKIQNGKMTEEDARHPTLTFDVYPLNALGHTHNHSHSHTQTHTHTVHSYLDTNTYIQSLVMLSSYPNLPRSS